MEVSEFSLIKISVVMDTSLDREKIGLSGICQKMNLEIRQVGYWAKEIGWKGRLKGWHNRIQNLLRSETIMKKKSK